MFSKYYLINVEHLATRLAGASASSPVTGKDNHYERSQGADDLDG
jgi:hypothetical protein